MTSDTGSPSGPLLHPAFDHGELGDVPAGKPGHRPRDWDERDAGQAEQHGPPQDTPTARVENRGAAGAGNVAANPSHIGRRPPRPADDRDERDIEEQEPADVNPGTAFEADGKLLPVRADVGRDPS